ncbi:MAG: disulfide bond formation protein B [Burkholderiaceae bacterium]|nr:disulfide bond formation protein B [Burkholderiaceae bacterium]
MTISARVWLGGIAAVSLTAVGAALVSQHVFEMQPCPWCVLQRLIFVLIALLAVLGLAWRSVAGQRGVALGLLALSAAGIATVLWQHFVAAASTSCNLTLADRIMNASGLPGLLPEIFEARATCADAAVNLYGVPYEFWSLALFVAIEAAAISLLLRSSSKIR